MAAEPASRIDVAVHEAGHCVIALHLGWSLEAEAICLRHTDGRDGWSGESIFQDRAPGPKFSRDQIRICLAGPLAEARQAGVPGHFPSDPISVEHWDDVDVIARDLVVAAEVDTFLDAEVAAVDAQLEEGWSKVAKLVELLMTISRSRFSSDEVMDAIASGPDSPNRRSPREH